jgi:hypothetical protein
VDEAQGKIALAAAAVKPHLRLCYVLPQRFARPAVILVHVKCRAETDMLLRCWLRQQKARSSTVMIQLRSAPRSCRRQLPTLCMCS